MLILLSLKCIQVKAKINCTLNHHFEIITAFNHLILFITSFSTFFSMKEKKSRVGPNFRVSCVMPILVFFGFFFALEVSYIRRWWWILTSWLWTKKKEKENRNPKTSNIKLHKLKVHLPPFLEQTQNKYSTIWI